MWALILSKNCHNFFPINSHSPLTTLKATLTTITNSKAHCRELSLLSYSSSTPLGDLICSSGLSWWVHTAGHCNVTENFDSILLLCHYITVIRKTWHVTEKHFWLFSSSMTRTFVLFPSCFILQLIVLNCNSPYMYILFNFFYFSCYFSKNYKRHFGNRPLAPSVFNSLRQYILSVTIKNKFILWTWINVFHAGIRNHTHRW